MMIYLFVNMNLVNLVTLNERAKVIFKPLPLTINGKKKLFLLNYNTFYINKR